MWAGFDAYKMESYLLRVHLNISFLLPVIEKLENYMNMQIITLLMKKKSRKKKNLMVTMLLLQVS